MGPGFQVWKHHLEIRPWEEKRCLAWAYDPWVESFSYRGLVFGGEEISMPETWPIQKSYNSHIVTYVQVHCKYIRPDYDGTLAIHSTVNFPFKEVFGNNKKLP